MLLELLARGGGEEASGNELVLHQYSFLEKEGHTQDDGIRDTNSAMKRPGTALMGTKAGVLKSDMFAWMVGWWCWLIAGFSNLSSLYFSSVYSSG
jgi:hypothetical protein